nr:cytochrome b5-like protein [Yponomeuta cagnagella]
MKICAPLLSVTALFQVLSVGHSETLLDDHIEGCEDTVITGESVAQHPGDYAQKTFRDINDFKDYPNKSQEPQNNYTWMELATLDGEDGRHLCLVLDRKVYDVTDFADQHPAGPKVIKKYVGRDVTVGFQLCGMPPGMVTPVLKLFLVGQLASSETGTYEKPDQSCSK